ncbi:MAG TPA: FKBP-type peptidyl-prolyl cis-trans isomerase [Spongiibacteraceae bacterium]|jgi:FKBP-type peptidyl-prolyl cis-trans isomerase SlpA|nr:FKBP-type peptidyl-prolyl cis-trans isomerase [Spongiibacteraceae bacterium]HUH38809.1 FKBP-type peptidyl-prolyl cis-trans isomerase [Spongiibacteraceae bacterium]
MSSPELAIGPNTRVTLHFALKLEDGAVVDSTFERSPASFTVGDGNLLPGFEKRLFGLTAGQRGSYQVPPEDAFGQPNPANVQRLPRSQFAADMELSEGLILSFADANRAETPGVVARFDSEEVVVDFNHPLAGHTLSFDVEILRVEPGLD